MHRWTAGLASLALVSGCQGSNGDRSGPRDEVGETDVLTGSCDVAFAALPEIRGNDPLFPLSRAVAVHLSGAARLLLTATDAEGEEVRWASPSAPAHDLPLVGLHADGEWTLTISAFDESDCEVTAEPVTFATDPLPTPLPHLTLRASVPESMEPGLTVIPIYTKDISYIALVDADGRIVWLYGPTVPKFTEIVPLPDGHLLALTDSDVIEFDWMGVVRVRSSQSSKEASSEPLEAPDFHHDMLISSRGTLVALTKGSLVVSEFPGSEEIDGVFAETKVAVDLITEFAADGSIAAQWDVTTMLDLKRLGFDSLTQASEGVEWSHVNAVVEDTVNNRWILSARNQDAVFAVRQSDGGVDWILGNHDNWHAEHSDLLLDRDGDTFEWQYHQHACKYDAATNRVMVFDNGNYRSSPWTDADPPMPPSASYSRIVEYTIDETSRTVHQNWDFRLIPGVFSFAMGDADWLPNGNVLADFAYVEWEGGEPMETLGRGHNSFRVVEFDPATGAVIWDLDVWGDLATEDPNAWQAYRTQRIPRPFAAP